MTPFAPMFTLAYTPMWDSLRSVFPNLDNYALWLLVPLVLVISLIYRGVKVRTLRELPWATVLLSGQILLIMGTVAAGIYLVHELGIYFWPGT